MRYSSTFNLIKSALFNQNAEKIQDSELPEIFETMKSQAVAALPYYLIRDYKIDEWNKFCAASLANWIKVMHGQDELLKLLEANDIPCVIIKGAAAAMSYPIPSLRQMGDVDFLVKRSDYERTAKLLEDNDYELFHDKNPQMHHYGYKKDKVSFELHRRLGIIRESNEEMLSLFEQGIDRKEIHSIEGFVFPTLPIELNGVVLLYHINQHLRSGLGLRQIIDWMMYIDKLPNEIWKEKVEPVLSKTGMKTLAITVTAMCQRYLGLRKTITWCDSADPETVKDLMKYIMSKGNFGRKRGEKGKIASVYQDISNPVRLFKRLQEGGIGSWKAAKKHKILRPFAWIYQSGRIIKELIHHRISPKEMARQHKAGLEQRKMIERLGLGIDREI